MNNFKLKSTNSQKVVEGNIVGYSNNDATIPVFDIWDDGELLESEVVVDTSIGNTSDCGNWILLSDPISKVDKKLQSYLMLHIQNVINLLESTVVNIQEYKSCDSSSSMQILNLRNAFLGLAISSNVFIDTDKEEFIKVTNHLEVTHKLLIVGIRLRNWKYENSLSLMELNVIVTDGMQYVNNLNKTINK